MNNNTLSAISFTIFRTRTPLTGDPPHDGGGHHAIGHYELTPWSRLMCQDAHAAQLISHCPRCGLFMQSPMTIAGLDLVSGDASYFINLIKGVLENGRAAHTREWGRYMCGDTPAKRRAMKRNLTLMRHIYARAGRRS